MVHALVTFFGLIKTQCQTVRSYKNQYKRQTPQHCGHYHDWKKVWHELIYILYIHMMTWKKWILYWSLCWYWLGQNTSLTVPYFIAALWEVINVNIRGRHLNSFGVIMTEKKVQLEVIYTLYIQWWLENIDSCTYHWVGTG